MKSLRELLQTESVRLLSDWTREELLEAVKKTRQESGGLSLNEVAEVIQEVFTKEEWRAFTYSLKLHG